MMKNHTFGTAWAILALCLGGRLWTAEPTNRQVDSVAGLQLNLVGVAAIGEREFAYLIDPTTSAVIELSMGTQHPCGLELVKIVPTAFGGSRVCVRSNGVDHWLNLSTHATLAISPPQQPVIEAAATPPAAAPPSNLGTFSNEMLSKRFETPSTKRKAGKP